MRDCTGLASSSDESFELDSAGPGDMFSRRRLSAGKSGEFVVDVGAAAAGAAACKDDSLFLLPRSATGRLCDDDP